MHAHRIHSDKRGKHLRLCLRVWRGREGRVLEKRKEQVEEIEYIERGGLIFLHNTKPSSFGRTKKLYWRRVLEGLYEFFKFNLCCYNILDIKNI